jgi:hypothetical protein
MTFPTIDAAIDVAIVEPDAVLAIVSLQIAHGLGRY